MKKIIAFLFIILLACLAIFFGSPYYTANQLKNAYDSHDGQAIVTHIDFDKLQPNIQTQLEQKFAVTLTKYPMVAQLGGTALTKAANDFIALSVSEAVTAENVDSLITLQGQSNVATKKLAAAWAIASNQLDLQLLIQDFIAQQGDVNKVIANQIQIMMNSQSQTLAQNSQTGEDTIEPSLAYCGINCFTMSGMVKGYPVRLEMQREGLIDWKIVNVTLP